MAWVRAWRLELAPTMEAALATWIAGHLQAFAPPADTPVIARISPSATRPAADQAFAHLEMMDVPMRAWRLARPRGVDASLPGASSRKPGIDVDPADMALLVESNQGWAAWQIDGAGIADIRYGGAKPSVPLLTLAAEAYRLHGWFSVHRRAGRVARIRTGSKRPA